VTLLQVAKLIPTLIVLSLLFLRKQEVLNLLRSTFCVAEAIDPRPLGLD
jgi:hypothetical protein